MGELGHCSVVAEQPSGSVDFTQDDMTLKPLEPTTNLAEVEDVGSDSVFARSGNFWRDRSRGGASAVPPFVDRSNWKIC